MNATMSRAADRRRAAHCRLDADGPSARPPARCDAARSAALALAAACIAGALAACGGDGGIDAPPLVTHAQYDWEALTMAPYTVLIDLDGPPAQIDTALAAVMWPQADEARTVFVRGRDTAAAAGLAEQLRKRGVTRVSVVGEVEP